MPVDAAADADDRIGRRRAPPHGRRHVVRKAHRRPPAATGQREADGERVARLRTGRPGDAVADRLADVAGIQGEVAPGGAGGPGGVHAEPVAGRPSQSLHGARPAMPPATSSAAASPAPARKPRRVTPACERQALPASADRTPVSADRPKSSPGQTSTSHRMSSRVPSTSPIVAQAGRTCAREMAYHPPFWYRRERSDVGDIDAAPHEVTPELAAVAATVGAPDFIVAWLDRFYDEDDVDLLLATGESALAGAGEARLARAVRRAILDCDESGVHTAVDFHARLEIWAMFEGWKDVPLAVHRQLADWDVDPTRRGSAPTSRRPATATPATPTRPATPTSSLMRPRPSSTPRTTSTSGPATAARSCPGAASRWTSVCASTTIAAWAGTSRVSAPVDILLAADKAGLMHTADVRDDLAGTSSICNCCTDCCYPHLAADRLDVSETWPVRRYVARIDMDLCKACGRCGLRCPFEAIVCRSGGRPELDAALCRGCGLCATGCSADAIELLPLAESAPPARSERDATGRRRGSGAQR